MGAMPYGTYCWVVKNLSPYFLCINTEVLSYKDNGTKNDLHIL